MAKKNPRKDWYSWMEVSSTSRVKQLNKAFGKTTKFKTVKGMIWAKSK